LGCLLRGLRQGVPGEQNGVGVVYDEETMTDGPWRIGNAQDPRDVDLRFKDEYAAIDAAQAMASHNWSMPVAVWDEQDDIVHLFLCGQQFKPA
jgi:hypothetical protein